MFALGVPETDLRRASALRGRALRSQDGAPARDPAAGRLRAGRRGWWEIALAPRDDGEFLYLAALRAGFTGGRLSRASCSWDRRLGF